MFDVSLVADNLQILSMSKNFMLHRVIGLYPKYRSCRLVHKPVFIQLYVYDVLTATELNNVKSILLLAQL